MLRGSIQVLPRATLGRDLGWHEGRRAVFLARLPAEDVDYYQIDVNPDEHVTVLSVKQAGKYYLHLSGKTAKDGEVRVDPWVRCAVIATL